MFFPYLRVHSWQQGCRGRLLFASSMDGGATELLHQDGVTSGVLVAAKGQDFETSTELLQVD